MLNFIIFSKMYLSVNCSVGEPAVGEPSVGEPNRTPNIYAIKKFA